MVGRGGFVHRLKYLICVEDNHLMVILSFFTIFYGLTIVFYGLICFLWFFLWLFYAFSMVCRWFFYGLFLSFLYSFLPFSMVPLYSFRVFVTFHWSITGNLWLFYGFLWSTTGFLWFFMVFMNFFMLQIIMKNTQTMCLLSMCLLSQTQVPIIVIMWICQIFFLKYFNSAYV